MAVAMQESRLLAGWLLVGCLLAAGWLLAHRAVLGIQISRGKVGQVSPPFFKSISFPHLVFGVCLQTPASPSLRLHFRSPSNPSSFYVRPVFETLSDRSLAHTHFTFFERRILLLRVFYTGAFQVCSEYRNDFFLTDSLYHLLLTHVPQYKSTEP